MIRYALLAVLFAFTLTACSEKSETEIPTAAQEISAATAEVKTTAKEMTEEAPSTEAVEATVAEAEAAVDAAIEAATTE